MGAKMWRQNVAPKCDATAPPPREDGPGSTAKAAGPREDHASKKAVKKTAVQVARLRLTHRLSELFYFYTQLSDVCTLAVSSPSVLRADVSTPHTLHPSYDRCCSKNEKGAQRATNIAAER